MNKKLILIAATKNKHKIEEFRNIFASVMPEAPCVLSEDEAIAQYGAGKAASYTPPEETGSTFAANAFLKAAGIYRFLKEPLRACRDAEILIAADDSGLCVSALNCAPGVLSARYASETGENASDADNVAKLLRVMEPVPDGKRGAYFACAIAGIFIREQDVPPVFLTSEGHLPGVIAREPHGANGFGYDPILYLPEFSKSVAELAPAEKNAISHRGQALRRLARNYYDIH